jgi:hypothetical protein
LGLIGENRHFVAVNHVEGKKLVVEEARWTCRWNHGGGTDRLHVMFGTYELTFDLGARLVAPFFDWHVVHHRIPNGATELQPVLIHMTVSCKRPRIVRSAVVLVHQTRLTVFDHEGRIATGAITNR